MCEYCSRSFICSALLKDHISTIHLGTVEHRCDLCDKVLVSAPSLRIHRRQVQQFNQSGQLFNQSLSMSSESFSILAVFSWVPFNQTATPSVERQRIINCKSTTIHMHNTSIVPLRGIFNHTQSMVQMVIYSWRTFLWSSWCQQSWQAF